MLPKPAARTLALLLLTAACSGASDADAPAEQPGDAAAVRSAIEQANASLVQALKRGDFQAAADHFTTDAILLPPGMESVQGRESVRDWYAGALGALTLDELSISTEEVEVYGETAYEMGTNSFALSASGQRVAQDRGKYIVIWKRQPDGSWKIWRDIGNSSVSPQSDGSGGT